MGVVWAGEGGDDSMTFRFRGLNVDLLKGLVFYAIRFSGLNRNAPSLKTLLALKLAEMHAVPIYCAICHESR